MSYTKRQFVEAAFEEIGLAAHFYDLQPDQLQSAVRRLDSMIAQWNGRGIRLGYPISSSPEDSNLDTESGTPDYAWEAIILNLAVKIAPGYGKQVSLLTEKSAHQAYSILSLKSTQKPKEMCLPSTMPLGAGNKSSNVFVSDVEEKIGIGGDGDLILE